MITERFIKDNIHYIKETYLNWTIHIYPDPEFQPVLSLPNLPTLPPLTSTGQMLHFIIEQLRLKKPFSPSP